MNENSPFALAFQILSTNKIIYYGQNFYKFERGCYRLLDENRISKHVKKILLDEFNSYKLKEVICCLKADCYVDTVSNNSFLNVKNGLLNVTTFELIPHSSEIYSTIQLNVNYDPEAECPKWIETLNQIFEGDQTKIQLIQEYFGLSLTTDTKFEKALFCIGDGANGKSVTLYILQQILGSDNYSAIPLEKFDNTHYLAELFGALANITIETNAKSSVYDSTFKAIISGDVISADAKFKAPIKFRPHCKLIIALNNMPRVDDKTSSFFRRLLILRFPRIFKEEEQNKNLKYDLLEELDGIFNWCLQGYKRLKERGYFAITDDMQSEVDEYRKENNNVLVFVGDQCFISPEYSIPKDELYQSYSSWSKEHGYFPLSMIKFGKELKKQFPVLVDDRSSGERSWGGIKFNKWGMTG
jgi:putative DNA primase/helicase